MYKNHLFDIWLLITLLKLAARQLVLTWHYAETQNQRESAAREHLALSWQVRQPSASLDSTMRQILHLNYLNFSEISKSVTQLIIIIIIIRSRSIAHLPPVSPLQPLIFFVAFCLNFLSPWELSTRAKKNNNNNNNSKTVFMVLSSWQSHCESSPGSFDDECRTAPNGRRPKTKPDDLGCESACTGCQSPHPPSPFIIITQNIVLSPKADTRFTVPHRVEAAST